MQLWGSSGMNTIAIRMPSTCSQEHGHGTCQGNVLHPKCQSIDGNVESFVFCLGLLCCV